MVSVEVLPSGCQQETPGYHGLKNIEVTGLTSGVSLLQSLRDLGSFHCVALPPPRLCSHTRAGSWVTPHPGSSWQRRQREHEGSTARGRKPNPGSSVNRCHSYFISENFDRIQQRGGWKIVVRPSTHFPRKRWKMNFWWTAISMYYL